jgi:DNA primase
MDSDNNQIEEIKNRLDIVQVIEKYVKLKQAGKNFSGLCPFHNEKTPSFIVSPDLQRYKCFGCGETGDIYNFLQKIENIDFPEALERLAKQAGVELKKQPVNSKFKILEDINYNATKYFYSELKKNSTALKYLNERGFNQESIKTFGVGYAPKYPKLKNYLSKIKQYSNQELLDSGLFTTKDGILKEKFYDRIMFPIRSQKGTVLGFTGRILPGNNWGPKYMNSPDTLIFHKRENVFGQYESRQEIRKNDLAILCEGSTDVISAHQHGIRNIVAPLGTGLGKEQLINLSRLTKNFLFFFDSDEAGNNALIRAFKIASELRLNPYATNAAPYKDVDEILQKDPKKMKSLIENKKEAFSFILSNYIENKNLNKLEDINKVRTLIGQLLETVADSAIKEHYINKASTITKIALTEFREEKTEEKRGLENKTTLPVKLVNNILEKKYIQLLLLLEEPLKRNLVTENHFAEEKLKQIYKEIIAGNWRSKEALFSKLRRKEELAETFENLLFDLADIPTSQEEIKMELDNLEKRLINEHLRRKQKEISVKIAIAEEKGDLKTSQKYLKELTEINNMLK